MKYPCQLARTDVERLNMTQGGVCSFREPEWHYDEVFIYSSRSIRDYHFIFAGFTEPGLKAYFTTVTERRNGPATTGIKSIKPRTSRVKNAFVIAIFPCLLYTSPSPRDS